MTKPVTIRRAQPRDTAAVAAIYNEGIASRQATFQTRLREPGEVEAKVRELDGTLLVAELDGDVTGFATLVPDDAVEGSAGVAVYVARRAHRRGVGRALLEAIAAEAEGAGHRRLTARIFTTNEASIALFRSCGWTELETLRHDGTLDGEWKDVAVLELALSG